MTRTISNPANGSLMTASVIRDELQLLENEIAHPTSGHNHDGVTSSPLPLILGGISTTSSIIYKTTTGVGTTGADHIFVGGNNGATEFMRILNSGYIGIANSASTTLLSIGSVSSSLSSLVGYETLLVSTSGNTNAITFACENRKTSASDAGAALLFYSNDGAAMASGDRLGGMFFGGSSSASSLRNSTAIASFAEENWVDASTYASYIAFYTTGIGTTSRTEKVRITADGYLLIGTTTQASVVDISHNWSGSSSANLMLSSTSYGDSVRFTMRNAGGSSSAPTKTTSGTTLGNFNFRGYYEDAGGGFTTGVVSMNAVAEEDFTSTAQGAGFQINSRPIGSSSGFTIIHGSANGNIVLGVQSALATNATDGFTYIPTCAGAPSGTPTAYTGKVAMVFDTTNNKLMVYDGGWIGVTLS